MQRERESQGELETNRQRPIGAYRDRQRQRQVAT